MARKSVNFVATSSLFDLERAGVFPLIVPYVLVEWVIFRVATNPDVLTLLFDGVQHRVSLSFD